MALIDDQKTLGGEPVVTLAIGGHTLSAFVVGYDFEERCQRAGGLRIWLDNRGDEFDDLAADYPGLVRGAAIDLRRGLAAGTVKLPRTWVDGLRYVFVEGAAMLELECIDWWDLLDRFRHNAGQIWTNTEVRTIVAAILTQVGLTIAAGDFGVLINFGCSVRRGGDEAVRDAMSRVQEYLYSDVDGNILHKVLDPAEASGYTYDWSVGGGANHPLLKGTQISEQSLRFNKITVVGGGNWEYIGSASDAGEIALVGTRERTLSDGYLSSDAECVERAQAELRYWQAQNLSGKVVARPHFTLSLYDMITVGAPAWGGPARVGRVMGWKEQYGRLRGVWEQQITVGEVAYLAMGSSGLGYGAIVGEHIDSETGLIVSAYKVRQDGEIVQVSYAEVDAGWGTTATHEAIGHGAAEPEALLELIARTYDGGAHGGVASVTISLDTETGTIALGGIVGLPVGMAYLELTELAADPAAPGLNRVRLYPRDDGGGNTQLCARFNTGAIDVLSEQGTTLDARFVNVGGDTMTGTLDFTTAAAAAGALSVNSGVVLHNYGTNNLFLGPDVGNFTLTGAQNVGAGISCLMALTSGSYNVAVGAWSAAALQDGQWNVALGRRALQACIDGNSNMALGHFALNKVTSGSGNVGLGGNSVEAVTTADSNLGIGFQALMSCVLGERNVAVGAASLTTMTGSYNVGIGTFAGRFATGNNNVFVGYYAGEDTDAGVCNVMVGVYAGLGAAGAVDNSVILGYYAGRLLSTGDNNILVGYQAGDNLSTGASNIIIGYDIDPPLATTSFHLNIGGLITGQLDTYRLGFGYQHVADKHGQVVQASGQFEATGDAQGTIQMCARRLVTHSDANWYELFLDGAGASERMTMATDTTWSFEALVVGATIGCAKSFGFKIVGVIRNEVGVVTLLDHSVDVLYDEHELGWSARASADDGNDALLIEVSDSESGGEEVQWVATVRTAEVRYEA